MHPLLHWRKCPWGTGAMGQWAPKSVSAQFQIWVKICIGCHIRGTFFRWKDRVVFVRDWRPSCEFWWSHNGQVTRRIRCDTEGRPRRRSVHWRLQEVLLSDNLRLSGFIAAIRAQTRHLGRFEGADDSTRHTSRDTSTWWVHRRPRWETSENHSRNGSCFKFNIFTTETIVGYQWFIDNAYSLSARSHPHWAPHFSTCMSVFLSSHKPTLNKVIFYCMILFGRRPRRRMNMIFILSI